MVNSIKIKSYGFSITLIIGLLLVQGQSFALGNQEGDPEKKESIFDQLQYQEILHVKLEFDLALADQRRSEEFFPAVFSFEDESKQEQTWNIKMKVRGKFRRLKCNEMPPLKLDFKKKDLEAAGLSKFDEMKLVTYCVEEEEIAKQLLLKEFLAYKLYNEISEESFRVQLLKITYVDRETGAKKKQYGFLIEDTSELRARLGYKKWENPLGLNASTIDSENLKTVALFEAMIGNADWNYENGHNIKVMNKNGKAICVPYDFDFSGMVKAPYVTLDSKLGQKTLNDRIYLADPSDLDNMEDLFSSFENKKDVFIQIVKDLKYLNYDSKRETIQYLNDFLKREIELQVPVPLVAGSL